MSTSEAFGIAGAVAFLILYFRAVSIRWPESYFRLGSTLENVIASGPLRYVSFRFVPVFASCLFVAVTVERAGGRAVLVVILVTVIHLLITTGWATAQVLARRRHLSRRVPLLLAYSAVTIGVIGAAALALTLRDELAAIVPKPAELSSTLWTAAFAGLAGAYVAQLGLRRGERVARSIRQSKAGVDERLWRLALDTARRHGVSPEVVFAFMVVENLQRPPWFRSVENRLGRIWGRGSYGILQVPSEYPITDEESVCQFIESRLVPVPEMQEWNSRRQCYGVPEAGAVRAVALSHNRDAEYADSVVEAFALMVEDPPIVVPELEVRREN